MCIFLFEYLYNCMYSLIVSAGLREAKTFYRAFNSTPWAIKTCHFIWDYNSHVSWWIFTLFAPMETGKNTLSGNYKICYFTTIMSLHYLRKFKNTHNSTF